MLKLQNISKSYKTADYSQMALDNVSLDFRKNEFVAILGPSGSGKSTLLNIIGGLDKYDTGDLIINNKSTKEFKDKDWDAYRNNCIGFIFQNYNLITHISILENVEMAMTLSGVSSKERKKRAREALEKVGLKDHINKKPNQLSGGQMQRVAIARALVNNPDIIMADEPTGALDTKTSVQIMELIKEIAKDKLVIMVTHNPDLANEYASRIIELRDGKLISDSNKVEENAKSDEHYKIAKTAMGFFSALKLSFNNIKTKKGRTLLTAFASSIGIIGIAVILSLSSGFQLQIDKYIKDTMDQFPIIINQTAMSVDEEVLMEKHDEVEGVIKGTNEYPDTKEVELYDAGLSQMAHTNKFTDEYIEYLENVDKDICSSIGYISITNLNLIRKQSDGKVVPVTVSAGVNSQASADTRGLTSMNCTTYPTMLDKNKNYLKEYYDLLEGEYPSNATDLVLVVDYKNRVDIETMKALGFKTEDIEKINFSDIIGTEIKLVSNNDYYTKTPYGIYTPSLDYDTMYDKEDNIDLKIVGVVRSKEDVKISLLAAGIAYSSDLTKLVQERAKDSDIVKDQIDADYNILSKQEFKEGEKDQIISYLAGNDIPAAVIMYPTSFENKDKIVEYLDKYNEDKEKDEKVIYTDLSETITSMTSGIMDAITIVLIAFSAISLIVSSIMIGIITYISVLERTKEIGILRAIGARKKDITRVFNAETFLVGICSGLIGIGIAYLLTFPINKILYNITDLENIAKLNPIHAIILLVISITLTLIGGFIPAKIAAKKDPVEALRTE